uniref:Uncharacterized protein n=1 Tax=Meleagris gallopavo TaxID=9103 RepID=A0A803XY67_MELGA
MGQVRGCPAGVSLRQQSTLGDTAHSTPPDIPKAVCRTLRGPSVEEHNGAVTASPDEERAEDEDHQPHNARCVPPPSTVSQQQCGVTLLGWGRSQPLT